MKNKILINETNFAKMGIKSGNFVIKNRMTSKNGLSSSKQIKSIKNIQNGSQRAQIPSQKLQNQTRITELIDLARKASNKCGVLITEEDFGDIQHLLVQYRKYLRKKSQKQLDQLPLIQGTTSMNTSFHLTQSQKSKKNITFFKQNIEEDKPLRQIIKKGRPKTHTKLKLEYPDDRQVLKMENLTLKNEVIDFKNIVLQKEEIINKLTESNSKMINQKQAFSIKYAQMNMNIRNKEKQIENLIESLRFQVQGGQKYKNQVNTLKQRLHERQKELLLIWKDVNNSLP